MPIYFNPLGPVFNHLLIPLAKSLVQPYVTLVNTSILPLYKSIRKPCKTYDQSVERFEALIKTLELIVQFSVYFFLYQKGWHYGVHYLGILGGAITFSLIYGAGCWLDEKLKTHTNSICTGTWLYYKGIINLPQYREWMLVSVVFAGYLTRQHENSQTTSWDAKRTRAAQWCASWFFDKPKSTPKKTTPSPHKEESKPVPQPSEKTAAATPLPTEEAPPLGGRSEGSIRREVLNSAQNPADGKSE